MSPKNSLKHGHGNWVSGDTFWDRVEDLALFIEYIEEGANLLLVAQRRMGKTSLMREAERLLGDRFTCVFVDLQKASSAPDAVVELSVALRSHQSIWNKTKSLFGNVLQGVKESIEQVELGDLAVKLRAGLTAGDWADKGDRLFDLLAASEKPVLLLFDEVPIMVNRMLKGEDFTITRERKAKADEFMSWLRKNSIKHKGKVRMVISGSIGLEPVLHQAGLSATLNAFKPLELKPWDDAAAKGCIEALANGYGIQIAEGAAEAMIERLGCCIPHHVQMFFTHLRDDCKRQKRTGFGTDEVVRVYEREMLSTRGHAELTHYEERLRTVLGKEEFPIALDMLSEAAVTGHLTREALTGLREEHTLDEKTVMEAEKNILWVLEHDGYLETSPEGYVFVSNLLRDWWKARHGDFFTPITERGN